MKFDFDVIIVGAGPGGSTCALALAGSGLRVALLDKARFPRDKICGDALSGKVISVLHHLSLDAEAALHAFPPKLGSWGIRFFAPNGEALDVPFRSERNPTLERAPGYIVKRMDFDHFLLEQARKTQGVTVREDFEVSEVQVNTEGVEVSDGKTVLRAPIIVGADGAHSVVTRQLSDIKVEKKHYSAGVRAYYKGVTGFHQENFIELHYLKDLLPGYFWIFPLPDGYANVGLGMLSHDVSRHRVNLKKVLQEVVESHPALAPRFANARLEGKIQGFGLPLGSKKRTISGDRFLLTGDAAALIDPFTGEGIGNAMASGRIAAAQIRKSFEAEDFSGPFLHAYDQAVYQKLWAELNLSHQMQKLVNFPWLFNFVVRRANKNESLRMLLTMMFENLDIRKELSRPGFYWKMLSG